MTRRPVRPDKYERKIARGLTQAFGDDATESVELDLDSARLIVFSDHHKGARDGADDFRRCERSYNAALAYYLEKRYTLVVLGDAEELWECSPREVLDCYPETFALERRFLEAGRYERLWGNHDDKWRYAAEVRRHLDGVLPGVRVREALKLTMTSAGEALGVVFLVHGHQGTLASDRLSWLSRLPVRYLWRPLQRKLDLPSTTPSRDWQLRERHDTAMYTWAASEPPVRPVLIAGHTHRPVFGTTGPQPHVARAAEEVSEELKRRASEGPEVRARLLAELEYVAAEMRRVSQPRPIVPPCYFNTGCCSFGDGDVTGLELADGEIRLVRCPSSTAEPFPAVLAKADLRAVLDAVAGRGSADVALT